MIKLHITENMRIEDILNKYGVEDTKTVLEHPDNQSLLNDTAEKGSKATGQLCLPPETVNLPTLEEGELNEFILQPNQVVLDVIMLDPSGKPQASIPYTLMVNDTTIKGETDADGRVLQELEVFDDCGLLILHVAENEDVTQLVSFVEREDANTESGFNQRLNERGFSQGTEEPLDQASLNFMYQQVAQFPV